MCLSSPYLLARPINRPHKVLRTGFVLRGPLASPGVSNPLILSTLTEQLFPGPKAPVVGNYKFSFLTPNCTRLALAKASSFHGSVIKGELRSVIWPRAHSSLSEPHPGPTRPYSPLADATIKETAPPMLQGHGRAWPEKSGLVDLPE